MSDKVPEGMNLNQLADVVTGKAPAPKAEASAQATEGQAPPDAPKAPPQPTQEDINRLKSTYDKRIASMEKELSTALSALQENRDKAERYEGELNLKTKAAEFGDDVEARLKWLNEKEKTIESASRQITVDRLRLAYPNVPEAVWVHQRDGRDMELAILRWERENPTPSAVSQGSAQPPEPQQQQKKPQHDRGAGTGNTGGGDPTVRGADKVAQRLLQREGIRNFIDSFPS